MPDGSPSYEKRSVGSSGRRHARVPTDPRQLRLELLLTPKWSQHRNRIFPTSQHWGVLLTVAPQPEETREPGKSPAQMGECTAHVQERPRVTWVPVMRPLTPPDSMGAGTRDPGEDTWPSRRRRLSC